MRACIIAGEATILRACIHPCEATLDGGCLKIATPLWEATALNSSSSTVEGPIVTYFQGPFRASPRIGSAAAARAARQRFCAACQCEHRPCSRLTGEVIAALPKFIGPPPKFIVWAVENHRLRGISSFSSDELHRPPVIFRRGSAEIIAIVSLFTTLGPLLQGLQGASRRSAEGRAAAADDAAEKPAAL